MSLQYIIDGYNIINHPLFARLNKKTENKESALLSFIRINKICGKSRNKVLVVFDGYNDLLQKRFDKNDMDVIFSRKETADERIKNIVETAHNPKNIVVVSDDKEILFFAGQAGAQLLGAQDFLFRAHSVRRLEAGRQKKTGGKSEDPEPKISYSAMHKINQELRKVWLK